MNERVIIAFCQTFFISSQQCCISAEFFGIHGVYKGLENENGGDFRNFVCSYFESIT
jgi:hypothetical protein